MPTLLLTLLLLGSFATSSLAADGAALRRPPGIAPT